MALPFLPNEDSGSSSSSSLWSGEKSLPSGADDSEMVRFFVPAVAGWGELAGVRVVPAVEGGDSCRGLRVPAVEDDWGEGWSLVEWRDGWGWGEYWDAEPEQADCDAWRECHYGDRLVGSCGRAWPPSATLPLCITGSTVDTRTS